MYSKLCISRFYILYKIAIFRLIIKIERYIEILFYLAWQSFFNKKETLFSLDHIWKTFIFQTFNMCVIRISISSCFFPPNQGHVFFRCRKRSKQLVDGNMRCAVIAIEVLMMQRMVNVAASGKQKAIVANPRAHR